jgi:flagellar biosynthesis/type III secretory pathway chaperone
MTAQPVSDFDAALRAVMGDLAHEVDGLHASLIDERMALDQANTDALETVSRTKARHLDRIEKLDVERRHLGDAAGIDTLNDPRWTHTIERLVECRKLNEVNGRIVGQRIGHVRQALALLAGDSPGGSTYGPRGTSQVKLRSAIIAQV